jgi:hypothetical protein
VKSFKRVVTETFTPRWVKHDFIIYCPMIRERWKRIDDKLDCCFKCGGKFSDGEHIALVAFKETSNKVLCQACALELDTPAVIGQKGIL